MSTATVETPQARTNVALSWLLERSTERYFPRDLELAVLYSSLIAHEPAEGSALRAGLAVETWRRLRNGKADDTSVLAGVEPALLARALDLDPVAYAPALASAVAMAGVLAEHDYLSAVDVLSDEPGVSEAVARLDTLVRERLARALRMLGPRP